MVLNGDRGTSVDTMTPVQAPSFVPIVSSRFWLHVIQSKETFNETGSRHTRTLKIVGNPGHQCNNRLAIGKVGPRNQLIRNSMNASTYDSLVIVIHRIKIFCNVASNLIYYSFEIPKSEL